MNTLPMGSAPQEVPEKTPVMLKFIFFCLRQLTQCL